LSGCEQLQDQVIDLTFPHRWRAEILAARPLILPPRHFVYPREVEEVERGALELLIHPGDDGQPFLATCALGFRDPAVPTGIWSTARPQELCAVAGGYAYLIDTAVPERFTMLEVRPVLQVLPAPAANLLLFAGHRTILAWGAQGQAWESPKLSDEGITDARVEDHVLHGLGWSMMTDQETPFCLDLQTGLVRSAA
jgi:hypothetical protein